MAKKDKQDLSDKYGAGWYRDEKGRICYGDKCIDLKIGKKGIEITPKDDPDCGEELEGELFDAARRGTVVNSRTRLAREEPDDD